MSRIVCYGEVLVDIFPDANKIGGAPLNVANRLASFGNEVSIISAIGKDKVGQEILNFLHKANIDTSLIQNKANLDSGYVSVSLDKKGSATYEIVEPVAWDNITFEASQKTAVQSADAFIYGSLVGRNEVSRNTLFSLIEQATYKIFDINLRSPFYCYDSLLELMKHADFIKFNDEELYEIAFHFGSTFKGLEQNIAFISKLIETKTICVTKGKFGAVLYHNGKFIYNSGYLIDVEDTVGAGDSFLGALIHNILAEKPLQESINYACAVGALVASNKGANPKLSLQKIQHFITGSGL